MSSCTFKVGDRVRVIRGVGSNFFPRLRVGEIHTIAATKNDDGVSFVALAGENRGYWFPDRFELVEPPYEPKRGDTVRITLEGEFRPVSGKGAYVETPAGWAYVPNTTATSVELAKPAPPKWERGDVVTFEGKFTGHLYTSVRSNTRWVGPESEDGWTDEEINDISAGRDHSFRNLKHIVRNGQLAAL